MTAFLALMGSLLKSVATAFGMARDKQLRNDGANAQLVQDLTAENQRLKKALDNSSLGDDDRDKRLLDGRA